MRGWWFSPDHADMAMFLRRNSMNVEAALKTVRFAQDTILQLVYAMVKVSWPKINVNHAIAILNYFLGLVPIVLLAKEESAFVR